MQTARICEYLFDTMVSTQERLPALALRQYVRCYTLRSFDTEGAMMPRPIHALHEMCLFFHLEDSSGYFFDKNSRLQEAGNQAVGIIHAPSEGGFFRGVYRMFSVQLRPLGFFALFGIPQGLLTNHLYGHGDLFGNTLNDITDQLRYCHDMDAMCRRADTMLLQRLNKGKESVHTPALSAASKLLLQTGGTIKIEAVAAHAAMSLKTFERRFVQHIGVSPKLFARVVMFNRALFLKNLDPTRSWTHIAHRCGYYDQMHMIKAFKEFGGAAPEEMFREAPPPPEIFQELVEH